MALWGDGRHDGILVVEHVGKIDFDPTQRRGKFQPPGARVQAGPDAEHGRDAVRRYGIQQQFIEEPAADADSEAHRLQAGEGACRNPGVYPAAELRKGQNSGPSVVRQAAVISAVSLTCAISWGSGCMDGCMVSLSP